MIAVTLHVHAWALIYFSKLVRRGKGGGGGGRVKQFRRTPRHNPEGVGNLSNRNVQWDIDNFTFLKLKNVTIFFGNFNFFTKFLFGFSPNLLIFYTDNFQINWTKHTRGKGVQDI